MIPQFWNLFATSGPRRGRTSRPRGRQRRRSVVENLEPRALMAADLAPDWLLDAPTTAADDSAPARPEAVLVGYRTAADRPSEEGLGSHARQLFPGLWKIELPEGTPIEAALAELQQDPQVEFAEPDQRIAASGKPDDTYFSKQWAHHNRGQTNGTMDADIDSVKAWRTTTGTGKTIVAVVDSGIDWRHPDLGHNIWRNPGEIPRNGIDDDNNGFVDDVRGWDFVGNDNDPDDANGHGTHVAGIIGARGDNQRGVAGVSWDVQLMPLRFLNARGEGYLSDAISSLYYAVSNGATISNHSWGGGGYSRAMAAAISHARTQGHILVTAAGNDSLSLDTQYVFPASYNRWYDNVINVASTTHKDRLSGFSNYGRSVDIAAPGSSIFSTVPRDSGPRSTRGYDSYSGTSMAAPFVTGTLALVRDVQPKWSYRQLIDHVLATADHPEDLAKRVDEGRRLNAGRAVEQAARGGTSRRSMAETVSARFVEFLPPELLTAVAEQRVQMAKVSLPEIDDLPAEEDATSISPEEECQEDERSAATAAESAIPELATYQITVQGKVNGKSFQINGKLRLRPTINEQTLNDVNPRDVFLEIGNPLSKPRTGAIWLATNNAFFASKGYMPGSQATDLARVDMNAGRGKLKTRMIADMTPSGLNRFNASSGLLAPMYEVFRGGLDLKFTRGGQRVAGSIDLKGAAHYIPGFANHAVDYEARITGKRIR